MLEIFPFFVSVKNTAIVDISLQKLIMVKIFKSSLFIITIFILITFFIIIISTIIVIIFSITSLSFIQN